MLAFPNAKINLGLHIISKRADGYHNIETCFYPIPWTDVLEIVPSDRLTFTSSGLDIPGQAQDNLCLKAYHLLKAHYDIAPVHIHLHKTIPMGAGLGGGSSDGAFTLKMLNDLFDLQLQHHPAAGQPSTLELLAARLGSDCPFFLRNKPALATATGTGLHTISLDLTGKYIALKHPGIHVSTREAYSLVTPQQPERPLLHILQSPLSGWRHTLKNDFERSVFPQHPEIERLKNDLYDKGALYASMSGSGSAVYGIFGEAIHDSGYRVFRF